MNKQKTIRILLTGGGSGGHVYPLLAVAEELRRLTKEQSINLELSYMGPSDEYKELLVGNGIGTYGVISGKIRRYASLENILDVPKFFIGFLQALLKMLWIMPDAIFSKGGTGALPVVLAGWFYRIPVIIHESDASPGMTNLLSSRFAARIAVSFERALNYFNPKKTALIGTPIRREVLEDRLPSEEAKERLGFEPEKPLVLVIGGSQGSERINEFVLANLADLIKETQVLHQTGKANYEEVEKLSKAALTGASLKTAEKIRYQAVPYLENNVNIALAAADLVVARAGSGTIFEISAFGKPAILIPLQESANDHQKINAYEFSRSGGAVVIEEPNLLPGIFINQVKVILKDSVLLQKMSAASAQFFKPGAAEIIAKELLRIAQQ